MSETETPILNPDDLEAAAQDRRFLWVELSIGRVCVWEMLTRDYLTVNSNARRHELDKRGGLDPGESQAWQILVSCYRDEPGRPGARALFNVTHLPQIMAMKVRDFAKLMAAIQTVNASDAAEVAALEDFMRARKEPESLPSPSGASSSSDGFRAKSPSRLVNSSAP